MVVGQVDLEVRVEPDLTGPLFQFNYCPPIRALDNYSRDALLFAMSIKSFKCADTEKLFHGNRVRRWVLIERSALRKLEQLNWSLVIDDLRIPPGNRLESLKGARKGQYSIRINNQWRICFIWTVDGAKNVEIVDYH